MWYALLLLLLLAHFQTHAYVILLYTCVVHFYHNGFGWMLLKVLFNLTFPPHTNVSLFPLPLSLSLIGSLAISSFFAHSSLVILIIILRTRSVLALA